MKEKFAQVFALKSQQDWIELFSDTSCPELGVT